MSHSWLTKKRKGELIELAQKAGMPKYVLLYYAPEFLLINAL